MITTLPTVIQTLTASDATLLSVPAGTPHNVKVTLCNTDTAVRLVRLHFRTTSAAQTNAYFWDRPMQPGDVIEVSVECYNASSTITVSAKADVTSVVNAFVHGFKQV